MLELAAGEVEEVMERYLANGDLSEDDLRLAIRTGTLAFSFVPVMCGSAFKNKGEV